MIFVELSYSYWTTPHTRAFGELMRISGRLRTAVNTVTFELLRRELATEAFIAAELYTSTNSYHFIENANKLLVSFSAHKQLALLFDPLFDGELSRPIA